MHRPSRRGVVAIAAIAAIGGSATLAQISTADAAPAQPRQLDLGALTSILGGLGGGGTGGLTGALSPVIGTLSPTLTQVLTTVPLLPPETAQQVLAGLTSGDLSQLLAAASTVEQILAVVDGVTGTQLAEALAMLTPEQQQQVNQNIQTAKAAQAASRVPVVAAPRAAGRYQVKITSAKVNSKKTSIAITMSCPAAAPKGCYVRITGKLAGSTAFGKKDFLMLRNTTQDATLKLKSSATKRLKKKGGKITLTAATGFQPLGPTTKSATVKKPKKAARKASKS